MRPLNKTIWLITLVFLGSVACANAGIAIGDSLDWLVVSHDHVAIAKVIRSKDHPVPPAIWMDRTFNIRTIIVLKGHPPPSLQFTRNVPIQEPLIPQDSEFLIFLNGNQEVDE